MKILYLVIIVLCLTLIGLTKFDAFSESGTAIPYSIHPINDTAFVVTGVINKIIGNALVTLEIKNHADNSIIFVAQTVPVAGNNFTFIVPKTGPLWNNVKDYSIIVNYMNSSASQNNLLISTDSPHGVFLDINKVPSSLTQKQHYFEIWTGDKYAHAESSTTIQGNICPTPVPDLGTNSSIKVYGLAHKYGDNNPETYFLGENNTLPSCNVQSNVIAFQTRSAIDYAISAVAQWTENGRTITVQSGSMPIQILYNCIGNSNLFLSSALHPGSMASFQFHVGLFNCKSSSDSVTFTVYNYTGNVKSNILYQESKVVMGNNTPFNFTVPQSTDSSGLTHFLIGINGSNPWHNGGYGWPNDLYPVTLSDEYSNQSQNESTGHLLLGNIRQTLTSPLKQLELGSEPSNVACNQGFQLVLKNENGYPACVSPNMASKLIERNWGIILLHVLPT